MLPLKYIYIFPFMKAIMIIWETMITMIGKINSFGEDGALELCIYILYLYLVF